MIEFTVLYIDKNMDIQDASKRIVQSVFEVTGVLPKPFRKDTQWLWETYGVYIEFKDTTIIAHCPGENKTFDYTDVDDIASLISTYIKMQMDNSALMYHDEFNSCDITNI